jgi:L-lactate dehydrogenase complex protein LldF
MTDAFHRHIRNALANPSLQEALDMNSEKRLKAHQQAIDPFGTEWASLRQRAHAIRADVIAHLDEYISVFTQAVEANGVRVHRAESGSQALEIIEQLINENGAKLVAKSKSMVSEEIGLNQHLEARGTRVVETDLGEYIVQLRGEHPAHLLTPAVHLRRQEVGATFHEKLGMPYTDDIPSLVDAARQRLREIFLEAEIGLSGVNFGVVQDGTLCIVTNEGNGRMVTTLPPVHIALMGIERMLPTRQDLALMLNLLPRSATGQKLSVYTSLIRRPVTWPAGNPGQRHLVLLDNGRMKASKSPLAEALYCIRCGACLNVCPIFREIGGHAYVNSSGEGSIYQGPIGAVISPALFGVQDYGNLARASTLCGACKEICPVDIDLPNMLLRVRAGQVSEAAQPSDGPNPPAILGLGLRVFAWMAISPRRFALAQRLAGIFSRPIATGGWIKTPSFTGWGYSKDFPRPAQQPFRDRFNNQHQAIADRPDVASAPSARTPGNGGAHAIPAASSLQRFEAELTALGGSFTRCDLPDLPRLLLAFLKENNLNSILSWEADQLPAGVLEALKNAEVHVTHEIDPKASAGLTGALAAIAVSGSLALAESRGAPLAASLLPETHIALLDSKVIYDSLEQVLSLPEMQDAPAAVLISGPSRTADIEMSLTIGVHGPGRLHVFCW